MYEYNITLTFEEAEHIMVSLMTADLLRAEKLKVDETGLTALYYDEQVARTHDIVSKIANTRPTGEYDVPRFFLKKFAKACFDEEKLSIV